MGSGVGNVLGARLEASLCPSVVSRPQDMLHTRPADLLDPRRTWWPTMSNSIRRPFQPGRAG